MGDVIRVFNFYLSIINGNQLQSEKKIEWCCENLIQYIDRHIKHLKSNTDVDESDDYFWRMFVNFTANRQRIWINLQQLDILRLTNEDLVRLFVVFDKGGDHQLG